MNEFKMNQSRSTLAKSLLLATGLFMFTVKVSAQTEVNSSRAGAGVYEAVINPHDGYIYVTGAGSRANPGGALYKINPENLAILDSINLKENPPYGIGINTKTQIVYTTNTRTNSVSAIDLKTGKLIATIKNGNENSHTREVLIDETNNLIYISDVGDPSSIWVIDGKTNTYSHSIGNLGKTATGMTFLNGTDKIYVSVIGENSIFVVDVNSKKVENKFQSAGEAPVNLTSDGNRLFVANQKSGTITVLDAEGELIKSIPTGAGAIGIAFDPIKNRIYSANRQTGTTTVVDAKTYEVLADVATGSHPNHVKINPKNGDAFIINKTKSARSAEGQTTQTDKNGDTITKLSL